MSAPSEPNLRRLLRQQLESWHAAGVSGLLPPVGLAAPEPDRSAPPASVAESLSASTDPAARTPQPDSAMPRPASRPAPKKDLFADSNAATVPSAPVPPSPPRSRAERIQSLQILADAVRGCTRCSELAGTRTQTVFGIGNPEAKILFIGEAPGADEDQQGEPFVGRAGQLLNQIITACRMKREDIYICNILKCRPPGNRAPLPDECGSCREYLDGQLAAIDPEYIVCWGTVAAQNLLNTDVTIGKLRRRFYQHRRAKVLCTYHPSYLLRNPAAKKDVWDDMKLLFADMGIDLARKE
ncbi:MAG TPA: uracil-DNA glycosylase family protein [Planctomycetaceae bacterium]|jgi:DNA polymerase|nr:uracil-DNA glycosylase family protein [Planctomycetaceae bacterium]